MQRRHADAQRQAAATGVALEGAFGDVAPGRGQVLQQFAGHAFGNRQARGFRAVGRQQQVLLDCVDQRVRIEAEQVAQFGGAEQRLVARRTIQLRGNGEQAGRCVGALQRSQLAPAFQRLGQARDTALAHLVAAGAAQQQGGEIDLLDALAGAVVGQAVAHLGALQAVLAGDAVQLVEFQPKPLWHRAVQLGSAHQRAVQAMAGALQGHGEQLRPFLGEARQLFGDDQLVAHGQVVLQSLAEVGDLARALVEHDGLVEEVSRQVAAHEMHFRAQQFEQLQAIVARGDQLVQLGQALVELAGRFADVGLGQGREPALHLPGIRVAERQPLSIGGGHAQKQVRALFIHSGRGP